jgi:hypothetical protein
MATTYYVRIGGNDSNDGLSAGEAKATPAAAMALAADGDTVDVGAGDFDLGIATLAVVAGVTLQGAGYAGAGRTRLFSDIDFQLTGPLVDLRHNTCLRSIFIEGTAEDGRYQCPISVQAVDGVYGVDTVLIEDVWTEATADGLWSDNGVGGVTIMINRCKFVSQYDGLRVMHSIFGGHTVVIANDSQFITTGPAPAPQQGVESVGRAVSIDSNQWGEIDIRLYRCTLTSTDGGEDYTAAVAITTNPAMIDAEATGSSHIYLEDCTLTQSSSSGPAYAAYRLAVAADDITFKNSALSGSIAGEVAIGILQPKVATSSGQRTTRAGGRAAQRV